MSGPTTEVLVPTVDRATLDKIDSLLSACADQITRTRKGRVWDLQMQGRPIHVMVAESPPAIEISAGCNGSEDYAVLLTLSSRLASALGGLASTPTK